MWRNVRAAELNATLQLLVIYRYRYRYGARCKFYHIKIIKKKKILKRRRRRRRSKRVLSFLFSFPYLLIIGLFSWCSPWFIYAEKRKEEFTLHKNNNITTNFIRLRHIF